MGSAVDSHFADLVNFTLAGEKRLLEYELAEDAAYRPHVDRGAVLGRAQE